MRIVKSLKYTPGTAFYIRDIVDYQYLWPSEHEFTHVGFYTHEAPNLVPIVNKTCLYLFSFKDDLAGLHRANETRHMFLLDDRRVAVKSMDIRDFLREF
jgi:hypothetical protein